MDNNSNNSNFEKFTQEANEYFNKLSSDLGHPDEKDRVVILWKAVMHAIRERIHIGESLDFISSMPLLLKGMYVHNWKYEDKPSLEFESMEGMKNAVKAYQDQYGEVKFNWNKSTEEIISIVIDSMEKYNANGQINHIKGQMPKEVQEVF